MLTFQLLKFCVLALDVFGSLKAVNDYHICFIRVTSSVPIVILSHLKPQTNLNLHQTERDYFPSTV